ncbi:carbohydrate binding domain-containing protein [Pseudomonas vlassakiae]|uniref:carbohydrate binding domain-containing protein n=1 Tax=Pseudomonas vlassakiae TaxID=485888 RepID=UPI003D27C28D
MATAPYVDFSPFGEGDFNGWNKQSNGWELITDREDDGNYFVRFPEGWEGNVLGPLLDKTVTGFKPGSSYRFSVDFRTIPGDDLFRTDVTLDVIGVAQLADRTLTRFDWDTLSLDFTATATEHRLMIIARDRLAENSEDVNEPGTLGRARDMSLDFIRVYELSEHTERFDQYQDIHLLPREVFNADHMSIGLPDSAPGSIAIHPVLPEEGKANLKKVLCLAHNGGNIFPAQTTHLELVGTYHAVAFNWAGIGQQASAKAFNEAGEEVATQSISPQPGETTNAHVELVARRETLIKRVELTCGNRTFIDSIRLLTETPAATASHLRQAADQFGCDDWNGWSKTAAAIDLQLESADGLYRIAPRHGVEQTDTGILLEKTVSGLTAGNNYRFSVKARSQAGSQASVQLGISDVFSEAPTLLGEEWQDVERIFTARQASHTFSIEAPGGANTKAQAFLVENAWLSTTNSIVEDFNDITPTPIIRPGNSQQTAHVTISLGNDQQGQVHIHAVGPIDGMTEGKNVCINDGSIAEQQTVRFDLAYECVGVKFSLTSMLANQPGQLVTFFAADGETIGSHPVTERNSWVNFSAAGKRIKAFEVTVVAKRRASLDFLTLILN